MATKHYSDKDGLLVLSRNAVFNFIFSNRNYGKTWTFKKRAFRRAMKHGKKTIWLRVFKKELKECLATFYSSPDLQDYCGIQMYDEDTKKGNCKRVGNTFYYRTGDHGKWEWFLKVFYTASPSTMRSADDKRIDTLIIDECAKTAEEMSHYNGNMVSNVLDILVSAKREHEVTTFFIGNKEDIANPPYVYFGIAPLPSTWQGIRSFKGGSIVIQQINNLPSEKSDYGRKFKQALMGTPYGAYLYGNGYKNEIGIRTRKPPNGAKIYAQLSVNGNALRILTFNAHYYIAKGIDDSKYVYCDKMTGKYRHERQLVNRYKPLFKGIINAVGMNIVHYDSEISANGILPFYKWLGIY